MKNIKPTKFLIISITISSILITIIGGISLFYGTDYEKLIASCLAIPAFTIFVSFRRTEQMKTYWINDLHWFFWWIFSSIAWAIGYKAPTVILVLITAILFLRQKNFIESDSVGNPQTT